MNDDGIVKKVSVFSIKNVYCACFRCIIRTKDKKKGVEIGFDVLIKYVFFIEYKFMRYQNKLVLMFMFNKHSKLPLSFIESVCCCVNA